jgi:hypothetical protein
MKYTLFFTLRGALEDAVAVEWTDQDAPEGSGAGWEPCLRQADGSWRLSSFEPATAPRHRRDPGLFANIGLRYRLEATGPWSEASASRKDFVILDVTETPDDGEGDGGGEPPAPPAAPLLITAPVIAGAGTIGTPLSADPGLWTSAETPAFAYLWLRDGTAIAGATEAIYVPGPEDDLSDLAVRVTATNAGGSTEAVSGALRVTYAAPVARGSLFDEVFDQGSGEQIVETAQEFAGENLRFALEGPEGLDATIEPETGILRIATDAPLSGAEIVVTASNSGGSARSAFLVTIEAADGSDDLPVPLAPGAGDWAFGANVDDPRYDAGTVKNHTITIADPTITAVRWSNQLELAPDNIGVRCLPITGGFRLWANSDTSTFMTLSQDGAFIPNVSIRCTRSLLGLDAPLAEWSPWSTDSKDGPPADVDEPVIDPGDPSPDPLPGSPTPTSNLSSIDLGDGVVFTLSADRACGQYADGSWFIHNPTGGGGVAITDVSPDSVDRSDGKRMHGLMVNPALRRANFSDRQTNGWDEYIVSRWPTRYSQSLNKNPNLSGNITFAAGVEGSIVKSLGVTSPISGSYSPIRKFFIVTIVKDIPIAGSFRPCCDGECTSKAAIGTEAQVDAALPYLPSINLGASIGTSLSNCLRLVEGPFMSECALAGSSSQGLYGREQTYDKSDPMYGPVFSLYLRDALAHLFSENTSAANKKTLLMRMVQLGLVHMQNAATHTTPEFWPAHNAPYMEDLINIAAAVCDSTTVRALYNACVATKIYHETVLRQDGSDSTKNGDTTGGPDAKLKRRFLDASDIYFRTPPEGGLVAFAPATESHTPIIADQEPGQTPYTGGMIGFPVRLGSGTPNSGQSTNLVSRYTAHYLGAASIGAMAAPIRSQTMKVANLMDSAYAGVIDRYTRYHQGYYAGDWDMNSPPEWDNNYFQRWPEAVTNAVVANRSLWSDVHPVWLGRPEQPFPPLVSKPGSGQLRMQFLDTRVSNNGPLTGAQYRLRRVKSSNVSGSWQTSTELRNLIFYNTTAWQTPVNMSASATTITVSGLATGIWQVQWRLGNASGWGPWSTNVSRIGDGRAADGWPAGPLGVILI